MNELDHLKQKARDCAVRRNHDLGRFQTSEHHESRATAHCRAEGCTAMVTVTTRPAPNEYDAMGDALALDCPSKQPWE